MRGQSTLSGEYIQILLRPPSANYFIIARRFLPRSTHLFTFTRAYTIKWLNQKFCLFFQRCLSPVEGGSCDNMTRKRRRGIIEKRRRDRINSSLAELRRLVPSAFEKQGSAKLEKAEILQLTVEHLRSVHVKGQLNFSILEVFSWSFCLAYNVTSGLTKSVVRKG